VSTSTSRPGRPTPASPRSRDRRGAPTRRAGAARARRRRLAVLLGAVLAVGGLAAAVLPMLDKAVQEIALPLRHDDVIRQQAEDKQLDPALIAAIIYAESRFRDQTSPAGAKGLMQILPSTADWIARKSGGTAFVQGDLAEPQINIAYGSWYLRYLLDHYGGDRVAAIAAYNAGLGKVDAWRARAIAAGERFRVHRHIPYAETRSYVRRVLSARSEYRREYRRELGL
jgi:soluble lytic murein transglycosylase